MTNAPCKDCTERHFKCHSQCEKYTEWRKAYDEWKEMTDANKETYKSFEKYERARNYRIYKKYGAKK